MEKYKNINILLYQILAFTIHTPSTWNEEFELPDGSYSISDIQDYFEYMLKKYGEKTGDPSIIIYINK